MPLILSLLKASTFSYLLSICLITQLTFATNVFDKLEGGVPNGWSEVRTSLGGEPITLRIALKQEKVSILEQRLLDMSTPDHPNYGKHMTRDEVKAFLQPREDSTLVVIDWLKKNNVQSCTIDNDWINCKTNVQAASRMLETSFQWYKYEDDNKPQLRTLQYSVPESVAKRINLIQPTTRFGSPKSMRSSIHGRKKPKKPHKKASDSHQPLSHVNATCNVTITPNCLFELYKVQYKASPSNDNKIGYASFLNEYARYRDLALFEKKNAPFAMGRNFSFVSFKGGLNNQTDRHDDSVEANLDNQYIMSLAHPIPVTEFSTGGLAPLIPDGDEPTQADNSNEPYLDYLNGLMALEDCEIPKVLSHSYGEDEQSVPVSYNKQVCNLFMQLGARGVSIIFSSGDLGVGGSCVSNDGRNKTEYQPQFPAGCPYVTAVGATRGIPEYAASFSGGGFSRVYKRPNYQASAVSSFLKALGNESQGRFNPHGRGSPDVAAQGVSFLVVDQGLIRQVSGTSAAAPTFAAIIALLNDARISAGKKPLGFLNPWLYSVGYKGFNDITKGNSVGCEGVNPQTGKPDGPYVFDSGFNTTKGWDPVTGLGTPDFGKLLKLSTPRAENIGGPVPADYSPVE